MMNLDFNLLTVGLMAVSVLTNLTVQAIKTLLNKGDKNYSSNILAAIVAVILSVIVAIFYSILNKVSVGAVYVIEVITLAYLSFLIATVGYDKVMQAINQIRGGGNG